MVFARLKELRINPSPPCSDSVFVRRAFLDQLGILPTAEEAAIGRCRADSHPDKQRGSVDALLERPEFADAWALRWSDLLRNEEKTLDRKGVQNFHAWIKSSIAGDKPLDQFARELVTSLGGTYLGFGGELITGERRPDHAGRIDGREHFSYAWRAANATTTPSTAGRRTTITVGPICSRGSITRSSKTAAATPTTPTSSTASRLS